MVSKPLLLCFIELVLFTKRPRGRFFVLRGKWIFERFVEVNKTFDEKKSIGSASL